jgi:DNA modification methylase
VKFYTYKQIPIANLKPYEKNPRTHSAGQIEQIRKSIREFGFTNPILVDEDGLIVAGHGRLQAAQAEGLVELPAIVMDGLTAAQKRALVIADNQIAVNAGWDAELLREQLEALQEEHFDLSLVGFSEQELEAMLATMSEGLTDPDDVPAATENPITVLGDVWLLGKHRLVCGDCTDALVVEKALNGVTPHLMVTDPPYGVEYDADWRNHALRTDGSPIGGKAIGKVMNDAQADWREAWGLFPGAVAYIWHAGNKSHVVAQSLLESSFDLRAQIIWAKSQFVIGRGHYHPHHEPCWYAVRKGETGHWSGDRKQSTLWQIDKPRKSETGHSTQKPVECMKRPIENNSSPGQAVYEPFSGSGTTIIAAEMTGRCCHAIELNPKYVDVAIKRWQNFTGKAAVLESSGKTYDELVTIASQAS